MICFTVIILDKLGRIDILSVSLLFFFVSLLIKRRVYSFSEHFVPFREDQFQKGVGLRESKHEVTNLVSLVKMAANLPGVSSILSV